MSTELVAGDAIPPDSTVIEVRVAELWQLFNAIDPSPFREKDLDRNAERFILEWAREAPRHARLAFRVHLDRAPGGPNEAALLRDAIHDYFASEARSTRGRVRQLFRIARTSLLIGLIVLATFVFVGDRLEQRLKGSHFAGIIRESFLIGGWVAMWRPLELLLYDWWPILADARLFDRLAVMPVQVKYGRSGTPDAWQRDWPTPPTVGAPHTVD